MKRNAGISHDKGVLGQLHGNSELAAEYLRGALYNDDKPSALLIVLRRIAKREAASGSQSRWHRAQELIPRLVDSRNPPDFPCSLPVSHPRRKGWGNRPAKWLFLAVMCLILFIFLQWLWISDVLRDFNDGDVSYTEVGDLSIFIGKTDEAVLLQGCYRG